MVARRVFWNEHNFALEIMNVAEKRVGEEEKWVREVVLVEDKEEIIVLDYSYGENARVGVEVINLLKIMSLL